MSVAASGEDDLIARYFRPLATHPGAMGLRDDAAFFSPPAGSDLVLTKDAVVAGVHFFPDDPPDSIARKALRVNLSDLAAKGADPAGFLLALALNESVDAAWLAAFSAALAEDAQTFSCPLFGGDTVSTPGPLTISITAFGTLPRGTMVHRSGARPGDHIVVTGTIGDAALGLRLRRDDRLRAALDPYHAAHLRARYLVPQPRNALARAVREHASAAMDVSDGLVGDLGKLCRESGVGAEIDAALVPVADAALLALVHDPELLTTMLTGGDDYEILCTVPPARMASMKTSADAAGITLVPIGTIHAGSGGVRVIGRDGQALHFASGSFSHF